MDSLPVPDYDAYIEQLAGSDWGDSSPSLWFETSRGCWWGQKHLCSFCGFNAEGLTFRKKSADRAVSEICGLHERYPTAERLCGADNILDMGYLKTVMPRLAQFNRRQRRPLKMFWETKTNLRHDQVRVLKESGCDLLLAGVESFSDGVLELMDKGSTVLGNIQLIKWLEEEGISGRQNVIVRNPNETAEHYRNMTALLPFIGHLTPPRPTPMVLSRFSPYQIDPDKYGIRNLRAPDYYRLLYHGAPNVDLDRVAGVLEYDHDMFADTELTEVLHEFVRGAVNWGRKWKPDSVFYVDHGDHIMVVDRRGFWEITHRLEGVLASLYRYLDRARARAALLRHVAELSPDALDCLLVTWLRRRWICRDTRDRYLAVIPRRVAPPASKPMVAVFPAAG